MRDCNAPFTITIWTWYSFMHFRCHANVFNSTTLAHATTWEWNHHFDAGSNTVATNGKNFNVFLSCLFSISKSEKICLLLSDNNTQHCIRKEVLLPRDDDNSQGQEIPVLFSPGQARPDKLHLARDGPFTVTLGRNYKHLSCRCYCCFALRPGKSQLNRLNWHLGQLSFPWNQANREFIKKVLEHIQVFLLWWTVFTKSLSGFCQAKSVVQFRAKNNVPIKELHFKVLLIHFCKYKYGRSL